MAKKKKPRRFRKSFGGLEKSLKGLGDVEKSLARVRTHLRTFLSAAEKILSGHPHKIPPDGIPPIRARRKKTRRTKARRR